jgi:hypothetical protein
MEANLTPLHSHIAPLEADAINRLHYGSPKAKQSASVLAELICLDELHGARLVGRVVLLLEEHKIPFDSRSDIKECFLKLTHSLLGGSIVLDEVKTHLELYKSEGLSTDTIEGAVINPRHVKLADKIDLGSSHSIIEIAAESTPTAEANGHASKKVANKEVIPFDKPQENWLNKVFTAQESDAIKAMSHDQRDGFIERLAATYISKYVTNRVKHNTKVNNFLDLEMFLSGISVDLIARSSGEKPNAVRMRVFKMAAIIKNLTTTEERARLVRVTQDGPSTTEHVTNERTDQAATSDLMAIVLRTIEKLNSHGPNGHIDPVTENNDVAAPSRKEKVIHRDMRTLNSKGMTIIGLNEVEVDDEDNKDITVKTIEEVRRTRQALSSTVNGEKQISARTQSYSIEVPIRPEELEVPSGYAKASRKGQKATKNILLLQSKKLLSVALWICFLRKFLKYPCLLQPKKSNYLYELSEAT